jgi:hypothetical protein
VFFYNLIDCNVSQEGRAGNGSWVTITIYDYSLELVVAIVLEIVFI